MTRDSFMVVGQQRPTADPIIEARQSRTILLPLTDAAATQHLLPVAAAIARAVGATLHLLYVSEEPLSQEAVLKRLALRPEQLQGALLDSAVGPAAAGIVRAAQRRHSWLIVAAARSPNDPPDQMLNAVTREVLQRAPCPVLVLPPTAVAWPEEPATCHILLPLNGTPTTAEAIGPIMELAHGCGGVMDVLYVAASGRPRAWESGSLDVPRYVDQPQHEWPAWIQEFLERMCCFDQCPTVRAHLILAVGDPAGTILHTAAERQSNLIALVWRGRLDEQHGHIIAAALAAAPCPVLVVRTRKRRRSA